MRLKILSAIFVILFICVAAPVHGQTSSFLQIPGVDCGMAGVAGSDKCCYTKPQSIPGADIANAGRILPIVGDKLGMLADANKSMEEAQNKYAAQSACLAGTPDTDFTSPSCKCIMTAETDEIKPITELCSRYKFKSVNELAACVNCAKGGGFWSGFGCVPLRLENFITSFILSFGIGLGGFIALICIVYSAIIMQTSGGNPEKLKKAQENITSCIIGLLLIIFSIFILRLIGVEILRIPGLSF